MHWINPNQYASRTHEHSFGLLNSQTNHVVVILAHGTTLHITFILGDHNLLAHTLWTIQLFVCGHLVLRQAAQFLFIGLGYLNDAW
jgi:hypothetical protein